MKDVIISKRALEKERQLILKNTDKIALAEVWRMSSPMDLDDKFM